MPDLKTPKETIFLKIKSATAGIHKEVEDLLLPMFSNLQSKEDYAKILKIFYGFFSPVEASLYQHITSSQVPDITERRKSAWILRDLKEINVAGEPATSNHLPEINNAAQAFGVLYVLEGSTLGGRAISKMLSKNKGINIERSLSFFNGYMEHTGAKWTSFIHYLNEYAQKTNEEEEIIEAAKETFLKLKYWIKDNE